MVSKRVMLVGGLVVGVSYILAIERMSLPGADSERAGADERTTSLSAAQAQQLGTQASDKASDAKVERELAELTLTMARLKNELSALRDEKKPLPEQTEAAAAQIKTPEQIQAEHDEYMVGVERAFEREPRNEHWATGTSQLLRKTLEAEPVMLAAVRGIDCRSSSCRMELRDDGSATFAQEFPIMVHEMGAVLPEMRFAQSDLGNGAQLHVLYMSKAAPTSAD